MSNKSGSLISSLLPTDRTDGHDYAPANTEDVGDSEQHQAAKKETYNASNDPYFHRGITFTRAFTNDVSESFKRTFTHTFGDIQLDIDDDEAWTKRLLETYVIAKSKGAEGDIPLPAEFARNIDFWRTMLAVGIIATVLGLGSLLFLNVADFLPKLWANDFHATPTDTYFSCSDCDAKEGCVCDKYSNCQFYGGQLYWIGITAGAGAMVGVLRYVLDYPENNPGLFKEISKYHVDPRWSPATFLISMISLGGGMSLGPEQALASLGGGLATYISEHVIHYDEEAEDYKKLMVLGGMASALGALFPSPLLGVLMIIELGKLPKTYMESTLIMSCGACVSFLVYYALVDYTYIETLSSRGAIFAAKWDFEELHCFYAIIMGVICAALGCVVMIGIGVTKQIFNRIRMRLQGNKFLASFIPPLLAGTIVGFVNYALPLTVGNGNQVLVPIVTYTIQGKLSKNLLICSAFAKAFTLGVSMNGGFVGGFVFPIIAIGLMAGLVCAKMYPSLPMGLCMGCFIAGLPAAVCPMPFTLAGLVIFIFYFGLYQTVPIFLSCIVSYTIVVGSGLFGAMARRGQAQEQKESQSASKSAKEKSFAEVKVDEENKRLEEQYAFKHYLQAKDGNIRHHA